MADSKSSAPPIEQYQYQQTMPAAPPSYEQSMAGGAGGFTAPPPSQMYPPSSGGMYPNVPSKPVEASPIPVAPVVVQQVRYVAAPSFGPRPQAMVCPHCQSSITTSTESEASALAWIIGAALCFVGLWPCACLPCCMDSLQQVKHRCPSCKSHLGMYKASL